MNFLLNLYVTLTIFMVIETSWADRKQAAIKHEAYRYEPLGLIKNKKGNFVFAMPEEYDLSKDIYTYYYDDANEEFKNACVPRTVEQREVQKKWNKRKDVLSKESSVLFIRPSDENGILCNDYPAPTIKMTEEDCNLLQDKFYEVGYTVSSDETIEHVQFVSLYKICYSTIEGTLYTIHRIESPNLLLDKVVTFYELPKEFPSKLHEMLDKKQKLIRKSYYEYQLVPTFDMPTQYFKYATNILPNYFPVSKYKDYTMKSMMTIDNYIRLFSKKTKQQLTIYSGFYEYHLRVTKTKKTRIFRKTKEYQVLEPVKSFWRMITDIENNAVLIVTQFTREITCSESDVLCSKEVIVMLRTYSKGGCSYMCRVNAKLVQKLGLPDTLVISGELELKFSNPVKQQKNSVRGEKSPSDVNSTSEEFINILDFMNASSFMEALKSIDPALEKTINDNSSRKSYKSSSWDGGSTTGYVGSIGFMGPDTGPTLI